MKSVTNLLTIKKPPFHRVLTYCVSKRGAATSMAVKQLQRLLPVIMVMLAFTCCSAENKPHTFQLPVVPKEITDPQQRADYITLHFWDDMDFNNAEIALDTALVEQSMVDFLSILPLTSTEEDAMEAVRLLVLKAAENEAAFRLMSSFAEKYLYETESPLLDEDRYKTFIDYYRQVDWVDEAENLRLDKKEEDIARCRPGSPAQDMTLTDKGDKTQLSKIIAGKPSILLFYDNDCGQCRSTIQEMTSDSRLLDVLKKDKLRVVAIDLGADTKTQMLDAPNWIWAKTPVEFEVDSIYSMRSTPSLYLVGADGNILLKDVSYESLSKAVFHE